MLKIKVVFIFIKRKNIILLGDEDKDGNNLS
jgi:hypothetical protein